VFAGRPADWQPILTAYNSVSENVHQILPFYSVYFPHYGIEIKFLGDVTVQGFLRHKFLLQGKILPLSFGGSEKIFLLSHSFNSSTQYFIAAVAQNLSPSMKTLEKYFSHLQWFKTKKIFTEYLNCSFLDTALISQKIL